MQRPANLSSVAARLNNLEQIVDSLEPGEGGGGDGALAERIFQITYETAMISPVMDMPYSRNQTFYDANMTSVSEMLFGKAFFGSPEDYAYVNCKTRPFYHQVFGSDRFIAGSSLEYVIFGHEINDFENDNFVYELRESVVGTSLAKSIFGSSSALAAMLQIPYANIFSAVFGDVTGLRDIMTNPGSVVDALNAALLRIDVLEDEMVNLKSRVSALEATIK